MTNRICFIANYSKTIFFEGLAHQLTKQGKEIFWITVSKKLHDSLIQKWGNGNVLYINKSQPYHPPISDFRLNEILQSDRALRTEATSGKKFLESIQLPIFDFIKNNTISFIFGEVTWGHEILIHRISKKHTELNCKFLNPHTIRIPKSYFGFFLDEQQSELAEKNISDSISDLNLTPEKPDYLALNDSLIKKHFSVVSRAKRALNFLSRTNYDKNDPTIIHDKTKNFLIKSKFELNRETYRFVEKTKYRDIKEKKYILYLLHKQPEASIDVIGRYYDDQYINILNIWRALPQGVSLLVKEHSNAIGDRGLLFYRKISLLSDTYIIDEKEETYTLISNAEGVVTVSGTAAYESALMGIKSYTFAPTFFNNLEHCTKICLHTIKNTNIFSPALDNQKTSINDFSKWLNRRAFKGIISDPISNPNCVSEENLSLVSNAILEITQSQNS